MLVTCRDKGQLIQVRVLADGFEYLGDRYRSLSAIAIAKQITGTIAAGTGSSNSLHHPGEGHPADRHGVALAKTAGDVGESIGVMQGRRDRA